MYRIDNSMNDAPYQGIHIFDGENKHILTFWEDDAPEHEFNYSQRMSAEALVNYLNLQHPGEAAMLVNCFYKAKFLKPHERIKLEPRS